jgi:hypothetical protein
LNDLLIHRHQLYYFDEPASFFRKVLSGITDDPKAYDLYKAHQQSDLEFIRKTYDYEMHIILRFREIGVTTTLIMHDNRYKGDSSYTCSCGYDGMCVHAMAAISLYATIHHPDLAPRVSHWKRWIDKAVEQQEKSQEREPHQISLKFVDGSEGFYIVGSIVRGYHSVKSSELPLYRLLSSKIVLAGTHGADVLGYVALSGVPINYKKKILSHGASRNIPVAFEWVDKNNNLTLTHKLPPKVELINTEPPYYIDLAMARFGIAEVDKAAKETLLHYESIGEVPLNEAREFSLALLEAGIDIPLPDSNLVVINKTLRPQVNVEFGRSAGRKAKPTLKISVSNDENAVTDRLVQTGENTYTRFVEDDQFIEKVMEKIKPLGVSMHDIEMGAKVLPEVPASKLITLKAQLESLQDESEGSLHIDVSEKYPVIVHEYDNDLDIDTSLDVGGDLINLTPGILLGGKHVNLLHPILSVLDDLATGEDFTEFLNRLPDNVLLDIDSNTALKIPATVIRPLLQFIKDCAAQKTSVRMTRFDADALFTLQESLGSQVNRFYVDPLIQKTKKFFETLKNNISIPDVTMPDSFIAHLENYQKIGINWLCFLSTYGFGGILADDMGAGKTRQLIGYLSVRRAQLNSDMKPKFLVICPVNPTQDWMDEIKKSCPEIDAYLLHGTNRAQSLADIQEHELIITTYGTFANDDFLRDDVEWDTVILDEVQDANNSTTDIFKHLLNLKANSIFASSGAPMENTLEELRAVMDLVNRGYLGNRSNFNKIYHNPIVKNGSVEALKKLRRKIGLFVLRRKDGDDGIDFKIPENDIQTEYFDLEGEHLTHYEKVRVAGHVEVLRKLKQSGLLEGSINTLPALVEMRKICCDLSMARGVTPGPEYINPKLNFLIKRLKALSKQKKKALIFTYFAESMHVISRALEAHGLGHVCIDGTDSRISRDRKKNEFRENSADHIVATLKAMNSGANLPQAHEVFLYDPWFNPHKEIQAIKRVHRKGLQHEMKTIRLIFNNSIEVGVVTIREKKMALFDAVLNEDINYLINGGITSDDIDLIFQSPAIAH